MRSLMRLCAFLALSTFATLTAHAAERAIIVLDASGSMWGQISGVAKIEIARQTLGAVLGTLPADLELGLMAYGHRDKGSCTDIELIVPPASGTASAIATAANAILPKGRTPISASVTLAAQSLLYTEEKATVILITDGLETCEADPCATANALEAAGIDFTAHVVGFGLSEEEGRQVACLAENTGGRYFGAGNAADLGAALATTVAEVAAPAPEPAPAATPALDHNLAVTARLSDAVPLAGDDGSIRFDVFAGADAPGTGTPVATAYGGGMPAEFNLAAGEYTVFAARELASGSINVAIGDGLTTADVNLNAGILVARAMATETEPIANGDAVRWDVVTELLHTDTSYGPTRTLLVADGQSTVQASLGSATAMVPVTIVAGETTEVDVVVGAGTLVLRGKRSAAANDTDDGIRWDISSSNTKAVTTYGGQISVELPGGDYTVVASLGEARAEISVSVSAGKTTEAEVIVATGRLVAHALFAPGGPTVTAGPRFDVLATTPGADGRDRVLATSYDDGATFDLPPGPYILRATSDLATADAAFDLKEGAPTDVSVVLNAGLLAIAAPGGDRLDVLGAEKDIYGDQAILATSYGESWQLAVPAGDYTVKVGKADGSEATGTASVTAGQRTELTVQ